MWAFGIFFSAPRVDCWYVLFFGNWQLEAIASQPQQKTRCAKVHVRYYKERRGKK
jgi:hypothetical protein